MAGHEKAFWLNGPRGRDGRAASRRQGPPLRGGAASRPRARRRPRRFRPRRGGQDPRLSQGQGADAGADRACRQGAADGRGDLQPHRRLVPVRRDERAHPPVAQPDYEYDLPESAESPFTFTATVAVQPKVELPDWTTLEVPRPEAEVPAELVDAEIEALRHSVAELAPVEGRPATDGDVVVVDVVSPSGEARRDMVVELGTGRMVDELEEALTGMSPGETKDVEHEVVDGTTRAASRSRSTRSRRRCCRRSDDDLARAASEFDTLAELRADIEGRLQEQIAAEIDAGFRAATADTLVQAVRRPAVRPARRRARERAAERIPAHARAARHLPRDVSRRLRPDPRAAARSAPRGGRPLRRARARARCSGRRARNRGVR